MAIRLSLKVTGFTAAGALGTATGVLATQAVTLDTDGSVRFTDGQGNKRCINPSADVNALFEVIFTGTGGLAAADKLFGNA